MNDFAFIFYFFHCLILIFQNDSNYYRNFHYCKNFFFVFSAVLYTLAKQAKELNYKKLNLQVNNRIQKLRVPSALQEQVDVSI